MLKCPYCDFESMNQKNMDIHIAENHKDKIEKKEESQQESKEKKKPPVLDDFSRGLLNKNVKITFLTGDTLNCKILGYSRFEFRASVDDREIIVLKHAIKYIGLEK